MSVVGVIENISASGINGWCFDSSSPDAAIVSIYVDNILIRKIRSNAPRKDIEEGHGRLLSGFALPFSENLLDVFGKPVSITAKVNDIELPALDYVKRDVYGRDESHEQLRSFLNSGFIVDKWGALRMPFGKFPEREIGFLAVYQIVRQILEKKLQLSPFIFGGNLLGLMREGRFLAHDYDIDCGVYVSTDDVLEVADVFFKIREALIDCGLVVNVEKTGQLHAALSTGGFGVDVLSCWGTLPGEFLGFFGTAAKIEKSSFTLSEYEYRGFKLLIPSASDAVLAGTYGEMWKTPDPSFQFYVDPELEKIMGALAIIGHTQN